jgi:hypothetical protein
MWQFDGYLHEVYGFCEPAQLPGRHAELVARLLGPREAIEHLVLCPLWDCPVAPFGVAAPRASHALCLTNERLLVTRDYHTEQPPASFAVRRSALVGFAVGQAVLMSWLALDFVGDGALLREGFYFPRRGKELVEALLRSWRGDWPAAESVGETWPQGVLAPAASLPEGLVTPLLREGERGWVCCRRPQVWGTRNGWLRRWPVCLADRGFVLLTDRGLFYATGQPPYSRRGVSPFGHNLACVSWNAALRSEWQRYSVDGVRLARWALWLGDRTTPDIEVVTQAEHAGDLFRAARVLNEVQRSRRDGPARLVR